MECRVGLPTDGIARWRCDVCSLLNVFTNDECQRCREPFSEEKKLLHKVKKGRVSNPVAAPGPASRSRPKQPTPVMVSKPNSSSSKSGKAKASRSVSGVGNSKVSASSSSSYKMKKLKKEDLSSKHLGYKSGKQRNVSGMVRSKLNHDTAAYRAKFVGKGNPNDIKGVIKGMKKGSQYATVGDLTKNGWTTSVGKHKAKQFSTKNMSEKQKKAAARNRTVTAIKDARPVTPPPRRGKGQAKGGLLDRLQKAHSGEIMANMRSKGRYMRPQTKDMGAGKSAYTL